MTYYCLKCKKNHKNGNIYEAHKNYAGIQAGIEDKPLGSAPKAVFDLSNDAIPDEKELLVSQFRETANLKKAVWEMKDENGDILDTIPFTKLERVRYAHEIAKARHQTFGPFKKYLQARALNNLAKVGMIK